MNRMAPLGALAAGLLLATAGPVSPAWAQAPAGAPAAPPAPPVLFYGPNITLEQAKQVVAAAEAEAAKRKLTATIAIVDTGGNLVYFQKATNGTGTAEAFAMKKAIAAAKKRQPTNYDMARLATGNPSLAYVPEFFPFPGGFPIVQDGKVIGAIGETGGADDDVARAGAAAIR
jgi:glc operon protein GlcG